MAAGGDSMKSCAEKLIELYSVDAELTKRTTSGHPRLVFKDKRHGKQKGVPPLQRRTQYTS